MLSVAGVAGEEVMIFSFGWGGELSAVGLKDKFSGVPTEMSYALGHDKNGSSYNI